MELSPSLAPLSHGGDLTAARKLFPGAPEPFLDLSTGINPNPYPVPRIDAGLWTRLPEADDVARLAAIAAAAYGAPSPAHAVISPGTQILMALAVSLVPPGQVTILGPTYAEHARLARLAGHLVDETVDPQGLAGADLAIAVNPNNPDGRFIAKEMLLSVADQIRPRGGLLIVDEAFMDVESGLTGLCDEVERGNIIVLRSFGKFYGLPGLRLGFALASETIAARLAAALGPWPVSGAALAIGAAALADRTWREEAQRSLSQAAERLDAMLTRANLEIAGGTALFRLVRSSQASDLFRHLGRAGIFTRSFAEHPSWLRFGLPGSKTEWERLDAALAAFIERP